MLTEKEREALEKLGSAPANRLSPQTAAQFLALFLQGYTTEDIAKQNPNYGSMALGLVVRARIEYDWDIERDKYVRNLMACARQAVEKTTLEAVQFASDGMAVYHKLVGDKFRKFLQTGDPNSLGDFKDMSFKAYKDMVELLQKLTGQDAAKKGPPTELVLRTDSPATITIPNQMPQVAPDKPLTPEDAQAMLGFLLKKEGTS